MTIIVAWIVVGGANRIVTAAPGQIGGVTGREAFRLLATEWGRHTRFFAREVVRTWEQAPKTGVDLGEA